MRNKNGKTDTPLSCDNDDTAKGHSLAKWPSSPHLWQALSRALKSNNRHNSN